jgi:signal transduction histidine kinase
VILDELIAYVQLGDADRARLLALHEKLAPYFPNIAERFYEAVWANPAAAAVLNGPAQVERLRVTLIDWMSTGLLGPHDTAFYEKRSRIGRRHVDIGLAQQYMFTAMSVVRSEYLDRIAALYPTNEALLVVRSVDKLFDIELAVMLRHYQLVSEERLVARERTIQSDRLSALQMMSAGLAHEVRNPLNAAKLQLELLERRLRRQLDDVKVLEPIGLARHEIGRLTELLNEFLSFARPPELHLAEVDVIAIAHQVIELERGFADKNETSLELSLPHEPAIARVDAGKLHQVIQNLVRNALEAAGKSGRVTVAVAIEARTLHVRVADNGNGIPDDVRARIYEPFFSTKESGTGMGMSIVHNFVTMHGGTIDIATGPRGTSIDVAIPARSR